MEGLADRSNKQEVLTTANIDEAAVVAVATTVTSSAYRSSCSSSSCSPSSSFSSFLFLPSPVGNTKQSRIHGRYVFAGVWAGEYYGGQG